MMITQDKRHDPRVRVKVRVEIDEPGTDRKLRFSTTNLSVSGASCAGSVGLAAGALVEGSLFLPLSEGGRDVDVEVPIRARVTHGRERLDSQGRVLGHELGLSFTGMADADRAELRGFLFDWMAADSWSHRSVAGDE